MCRMTLPPSQNPHSVWATGTHTFIYHGDRDCPALRPVVDLTDDFWFDKALLELDPATGDAVYWQWDAGAWYQRFLEPPNGYADRFDMSDWRGCLRCGVLSASGVYRSRAHALRLATCPGCFLTSCDCDD